MQCRNPQSRVLLIAAITLAPLHQVLGAAQDFPPNSALSERIAAERPALIGMRAPGRYFGAALVGVTKWGFEGQFVRHIWRLQPAPGNCVVTSLLLRSVSKKESSKNTPTTEIAIAILGAAAGRTESAALQTSYLVTDKGSKPRENRRHHIAGSDGVPWVFDGKSHDFELEWLTASQANQKSELFFKVDGKVIRHEKGHDLRLLEAFLESHVALWGTSPEHPWACNGPPKAPEKTEVLLNSIVVETLESGPEWVVADRQGFLNAASIEKAFQRSSTVFSWGDGAYCPDNIRWEGPGAIKLTLDLDCKRP